MPAASSSDDEARLALQRIAAQLALDTQATEDLPMLAADALAAGLDSPALREAAGIPASDVRDAKDSFIDALAELGIEMPDEERALWQLARDKAAQIVAGEVSPYARAVWIWSHVCNRIERDDDLLVFIGRASEWEDNPVDRPEIEQEIIADALALLDKPPLAAG